MSTRKPVAPSEKKRRPHNAQRIEYSSFPELLALIAAEPRTALVGDRQVKMPRSERLLRLILDRALKGEVPDVTKLLQLMAKSPGVAATFRDERVTVISGSMCDI